MEHIQDIGDIGDMDIGELFTSIILNFNRSIDEKEEQNIREYDAKVLEYQRIELDYLELIFGNDQDLNIEERLQASNCKRSLNNISDLELTPNNKLKTIDDINFTHDIVFIYKIIEFRKLEIKKKIALFKYNLELYYFLIIYLIPQRELRAGQVGLTQDQLRELETNKNTIKNIIDYYTHNNLIFVKNYKKYLFLEEQLDIFSRRQFVN
jgi:hypothetical protein